MPVALVLPLAATTTAEPPTLTVAPLTVCEVPELAEGSFNASEPPPSCSA